jgi:hypothetical protein
MGAQEQGVKQGEARTTSSESLSMLLLTLKIFQHDRSRYTNSSLLVTGEESRLRIFKRSKQIRFQLMDFNIYMRMLYERH